MGGLELRIEVLGSRRSGWFRWGNRGGRVGDWVGTYLTTLILDIADACHHPVMWDLGGTFLGPLEASLDTMLKALEPLGVILGALGSILETLFPLFGQRNDFIRKTNGNRISWAPVLEHIYRTWHTKT